MSRVTLQQFASEIDNIAVDCLTHRDINTMLGRWTVGAAVGELDFERVPKLALPPKATPRQRKDNVEASKLLGIKPRYCFDAFLTARQKLADLFIEEANLEKQGYSDQALRTQLKAWATNRTNTREDPVDIQLARWGTRLYGFVIESATVYDKLAADFGTFDETEAQAASYDVALLASFKEMAPHDRAAWMTMLARPDGDVDHRTLAALFRVPTVLTGLSQSELSLIRTHYFRREWPQSAEAMTVLNQTIGAAHDSLRGTLNVLCSRIGVPLKSFPGMNDDAAEWLQAEFNHSFEFQPPTSWA